MKLFGHTVPHLLKVIYESLVKILKSFSLNLRVENTNQDQGLFGSRSLKASSLALRAASIMTGLSMYVLFFSRLNNQGYRSGSLIALLDFFSGYEDTVA